ncbi:MAG: metallophosphoesterase [Clostridia bacterium]|nr:metallophosphoesterase [Clostridia bacterium]
MKTAIVISDTHGNTADIKKLIPLIEENDYLFHLGDGLSDLKVLPEHLLSKVISVVGNCDPSFGDAETVRIIEGVKVFLTHGHDYGVKGSKSRLLARGKSLCANACFFGHSHKATAENVDGIWLINPGTLSRTAAKKSFCYCIFNDGKLTAVINDKSL